MDRFHSSEKYIHALRFRWLNAVYDPVVALTTRERAVKGYLLGEIALASPRRVLDVGCGSGTLVVQLGRSHPGFDIHGLDGDPQMLSRAETKAARAGARINFREGLAQQLPYADDAFDLVVSSLFFHHLETAVKETAAREIRRVLKPAGVFLLADWVKSSSWLMKTMFRLVQALDGAATTQDHVEGRLPAYIRDAGFETVSETAVFNTVLGTIRVYQAVS